jgi:hypothetical protein
MKILRGSEMLEKSDYRRGWKEMRLEKEEDEEERERENI